MTLVELIISLAVLSIVLSCCAGIILPASRNIRYNNRLAEAKVLSKTLEDAFFAKLKYAEAATITDMVPSPSLANPTGYIQLRSDGMLYYQKEGDTGWSELISKGYYDKFDVKVTFSTASDTGVLVVDYLIVDQQKTGIQFKSRSVIRLLNADSGGVINEAVTTNTGCLTIR